MARHKSRPRRWQEACESLRAALEGLVAIKDEYEEWRDNLPENLEQSPLGEKLEALVDAAECSCDEIECGIDELEQVDFPLGFGRD